MIPIKRLGRMRINNRKRLEYCSLFKCPKCGSLGEGNRLTARSQSCSQLGVIGRFLKNNEVAHHVNENKLDNSPENIELMSFSEHSRLHAKEKWEERGGFVKI